MKFFRGRLIYGIGVMLLLLTLSGCMVKITDESAETTNESTKNEKGTYMQITAQEAKEIMDTETGYVILDVRTESEYAEGHIKGAVLIPDTEIGKRAEKELTDKEQLILVYCRSGRRSKNAAEELANLGYTNVKEFGGIISWPYETVTD